MPFTPFHFGLGGVSGGYSARFFSFRAFCFANVLLDLEALYRIPLGLYPLHDWMHTFVLGALLPLLLWLPLGKPFCLWVSSWWNRLAVGTVFERVRISGEIKHFPAFMALLIGGLSHVFLDSIMHTDIAPLRPWSDGNPFYLMVSLPVLHYLLTAGGAIGVILMFMRCRGK